MSLFNEIVETRNDDINYYEILGCNELSSTDQIITEYRIKARRFHPDKNLNDESACEEFKKLQEAKEILTDEKMRIEYDSWRHSGMMISFKKWFTMKDVIKTSMHWATHQKTDPMIKCNQEEADCLNNGTEPEEDFSETLRKFRNYEI